jgi:hypothetical protein
MSSPRGPIERGPVGDTGPTRHKGGGPIERGPVGDTSPTGGQESTGPRLPPKKITPEERARRDAELPTDPGRTVFNLKWSPKCGDCWYSRCGRYMVHHNPGGLPRGYHLYERGDDADGFGGADWNPWSHKHHTGKHGRLRDAKDAAEDLAEPETET